MSIQKKSKDVMDKWIMNPELVVVAYLQEN